MAILFNYTGSSLNEGLDKMSVKLGAAVLMYASTKAVKLESKMKINRPWTDRTSMAKTMLSAKVSQPDIKTIRITLAHGVDYGVHLELGHGKRYAIIAPTIRNEGPEVVSELRNLMSKLR